MKKEIIIPVFVFLLTIAFAFVALLVFITRANPALIKTKLKLGALILSLSGLMSCGLNQPSCYEPLVKKDTLKVTDTIPAKKDTVQAKDTLVKVKKIKKIKKEALLRDTVINESNPKEYQHPTCYIPVDPDINKNKK
jgi:hypothetical protein